MNQYGAGQNVPYSGQQEADLVNNPRYTGQSTGTNQLGHDGLGPAEESRYGAAPVSTAGVDEYGNPRREGVVDRMKDTVGVGPHSGMHPHDATRGPYAGEDYTNVNHPSVERGSGGGLGGATTGYDQSGAGSGLGTGHHHDGARVVPGTIPAAAMGERRVEPGYDASRGHIGHNHHGTLTGSPRKEGVVEKIKDAVGVGKHDNASHAYPGTTTGTVSPNTYGTGESGLVHQGNTTATTPGYTHNSMVDTGLGHGRHPGSSTGYPHERVANAVGLGHRDAAGYPQNTTSANPGSTAGYPHETMGDEAKDAVGVGPRHGGMGADYDYERRGKGFEDTSGVMRDTRTGPGLDGTRTGTGTGTGTGYDDTNVGYPQNDANAYGIDSAPPKKGIMTKVKEKLHH